MKLSRRVARATGSAVIVLYVTLVSGAIVPAALLGGSAARLDLEAGLPPLQFALAALYVMVAVILLARYWRKPIGGLARSLIFPLLFLAVAWLSTTWSELPLLTARRALALTGVVGVVAFMTHIHGYRKTIRLVAVTLALIGVLSLVTVLAFPNIGVHQAGAHEGSWKGVYLHKNLLGREMALAALLCLACAVHARRPIVRTAWFVGSIAALVLVVGSSSITGWLVVVVSVLALAILRASRERGPLRSALAVATLVGLVVAPFVIGSVVRAFFALIGRDATLSGRMTLWRLALEDIQDRPLFGYGYGAFWPSDFGSAISEQLAWRVVHAHNGWIELLLAVGLIGSVPIVAMLVQSTWAILARRRRIGDDVLVDVAWLVLMGTIVVNVSDSTLSGPHNSYFLLFLVVAVEIHRRSASVETIRSQPDALNPRGVSE